MRRFTDLLPLLPLLPLTSATLNCRPEGPVLPKPTGLKSSPEFQGSAANLTKALDAALAGKIAAGWPVANSSFSLAVVSLDQEDPGIPIWEYHHLSENNVNGTKKIDRDSQYLIGSISKVISDYILLASGADIDAPITDFIPELRHGASRVHWQDVTLRMLATQLSGVTPNYGFSEYYYLKEVFHSYGFPALEDSEYPVCGVIGLNEGCSKQQFLSGMHHSYPVTAPMERPSYSSVAFDIFIMALENVTGKNYTQLVDEVVSQPLGMASTRPSPGDDTKAVIPPGDSSWGSDYGISAPGGGLVSSISDLSRFAHGLISRSLDLTPTQTRQWLKPDSFAGNTYTAAGMPWEIFRTESLTPEHPHAVTVYGKNGGAYLYHSQLSVLDEYGFALLVLSAGPMQAQGYLTDALLSTFTPTVDEISRNQAKQSYEHTFQSSNTKDRNESSVSVSFKQDVDSLMVESFFRDGSDIKSGVTEIWNMTMGQLAAPVGTTLRMFPTELTVEAHSSDKKLTGEVWRLWPEVPVGSHSDLPGFGVEATNCFAWTIGDWIYYGSEPIDRVIFYRDDAGEVVGFEAPFLRTGILGRT